MKRKFEIYTEYGADESGQSVKHVIKVFKNEPEALAFYRDKKNARRYGTMFMTKSTNDGGSYMWDEHTEGWVEA